MEEKAHGIILRTRPLTETSVIVHWLTRDLGRIATVAKGARAQKSSFRGKLDLFFRADLSFVRSRRSELHILRELVLLESHPGIRTDFDRVAYAAYAAELIELATETETPVPEFFELFADWLAALNRVSLSRSALLAFEWRLLGLSGVQPDIVTARLTSGARALAMRIESESWDEGPDSAAGVEAIREVGRWFSGHLLEQLNRLPDARARLVFL